MSKLRFENDRGGGAGNKIFYIASAVCIIALGILGVRALSDAKNGAAKPQPSAAVTEQAFASSEDWDAIAREVDAQFSSQEEQDAQEAAAQPATTAVQPTTPAATAPAPKKAEKVTYTLPVNGRLYKSFSGEELVFSDTMGDWRVHSGIDILAAKGDKIRTAAAGEVLEIVDDAMLGTTVIIRHNDGLTAYYCGLSKKTLVKKGEKISDGTVIGSVDTVPEEVGDPPHLHLAAKKNGEWVDPVKAMDLKFA